MANLYRVRTAITGGPGGSEVSTQFFNATAGTAQSAADAVRLFWYTLRGHICAAYTLTVESLVYTIDSTTGQATATTGTTTSPVVGTDGGEQLPGNIQGVLRLHTGTFIAGRELVGKIWIPGVSQTMNNNGIPESTYTADVDAAAVTAFFAGPPDLVVYSRKHRQFGALDSASTWSQFGSLRSRRL